MYDGMLSMYICMWFGPTFVSLCCQIIFQNLVGKVLFITVEMYQKFVCKFLFIYAEILSKYMWSKRVQSQSSQKSRSILARVNLSSFNFFNTVTCCSWSRGKMNLRSQNAGVKTQSGRKWG